MSEVVTRAREAFGKGPLKSLASLWDSIKFTEIPDQRIPGDTQSSSSDPSRVTLLPSVKNRDPEIANRVLFRAVGRYVQGTFDEAGDRRWKHKFVLPEATQVANVQSLLNSNRFKTYHELVESLDSAMDRLVALHFCNALLKSHTNRESAKNLNLKSWGSTMEFAKLQRYHSIFPLVSAYSDTEVCDSYPVAFAVMATGAELASEMSVSSAFKRIVVELAEGS